MVSAVLVLLSTPASAVDYSGPRREFYDVHGDGAEVLAQMRDHGKDPGHFAGTDWTIDYSFDYARQGKACRVRSAAVTLKVVVRMPRLVAGSPQVRRQWPAFQHGLDIHEAGHIAIIEAGARGLEKALLHLPPQPTCAEVDRVGKAEAGRRLSFIGRNNDEYDARTDHGTTQGAVFRP